LLRWDSLRAGTFSDLLLVGHTDPRGSDARNDALSVRRAEVLAFLRASGFNGTIRPATLIPVCAQRQCNANSPAHGKRKLRRDMLLAGPETGGDADAKHIAGRHVSVHRRHPVRHGRDGGVAASPEQFH
jgi:hypothetical protein